MTSDHSELHIYLELVESKKWSQDGAIGRQIQSLLYCSEILDVNFHNLGFAFLMGRTTEDLAPDIPYIELTGHSIQ